MAKRQRLDATITIGAALQSSVKNRIGFLQAGLRGVGSEIKQVTDRQRELSKQRKVLEKEGKAVDHLDREYEELNQTLERLQRSQKDWQRAAGAGNKVGQRFGQMTGEIGKLARNTSIAVAGTGAVIFGLASSTAELGDQTAKTADKLGIQIGALQELRYAAERSGVSSKTLDTAMQRFTRRMSDAAKGSGPAVKALDELGLSAEALASMTPDEALAVTADAMKGVENQSDRVRLAFALFDSEGVGMVNMLKDGSAGLQQLRKDARATGNVMSDQAFRDAEAFQDAALDVQSVMAGFKNTIGSALMPVVTEMMGKFTTWMRSNRDLVVQFSEKLAAGLRDALPVIGQTVTRLTSTAATIGSVTAKIADLVGGFDNLGIIIGTVFAGKAIFSVGMFAKSIWDFGAALVALAGGFPAVIGGIKAIGLALMANPIGLIIGGIALVAGVLIAKWDVVGPWFSKLWGYVTNVFSTAWEGIKTLLSWTPLGLIINNWGSITSFFSGLLGSVNKVVSTAWTGIKALFNWTPLGIIINNWGGITEWFGGLWNTVTGVVSSAFDLFKQWFNWSPMGQLIGGWGGVTGFFSNLWRSTTGVIDTAWTGIKGLLSWTPLGVIVNHWGGITAWFGRLFDGVTGVIGTAFDSFKQWFNWSPMGQLIGGWGGLTGFFSSIFAGASNAVSAAWEGIKGILSWTPLGMIVSNWGGITDWFGGLWDGIVENARAAFDWIAGKLEWVGNAAAKVKGWFSFGDDDEEKQEAATSVRAERPVSIGDAAALRDAEERFAANTVQVGASAQHAPPDYEERMAKATMGRSRSEYMSQSQPVTNNVTQSNTFNIYQQPGQDVRALAEEIARIQAEQERGALYDAAPA
ncbi:hypothetical protein H9C73_02745 [Marinobacterium sp. AK62]|uniref:Phage tail tape measure protein n=1 Tax=Marinobacterium alkalitolerans TaxID=1542925 RepID=A0ABS3Z7G9_9GAMM|nr:hypothetical protein [Marinobacterium alkalitolerans]MBP0047642.1 hypothetical protein [Marinobacterium alkalitolerans]